MAHLKLRDHLPIFRSPLERSHDAALSRSLSEVDLESEESSGGESNTSRKALEVDEAVLQDKPHFHRHTKATNAELFYDLFFVANPNVFTDVHEVNDPQTLAQYIGFFCIPWFTWYKVSLYDVRFSMDSVLERTAKALQFGITIGFATIGPSFDVGNELQEEDGGTVSTFRELSLILMASRLVLIAQYLQSLWFTRSYAQMRILMAGIAGTYLLAAAVYLGLFFAFKPGGGESRYLYTHMSLLTLIILGEGVIGLARKCQAIVTSKVFTFSASTVGDIVSAILVLYFLFLTYFDWLPKRHFGSVMQQIWAFLHFPLCLFMAMAAEDLLAQAVVWRAAISKIDSVAQEVLLASASPGAGIDEVIEALTATAQAIVKAGYESSKGLTFMTKLNSAQAAIASGLARMSNPKSPEYVTTSSALVFETLQAVIFQIAGFKPPESKSDPEVGGETTKASHMPDSTLSDTYKVFVLVFHYFFVSIDMAIVLSTLLSILCERKRTSLH